MSVTIELPQSLLRATHVDGKIAVLVNDVQAHLIAVADDFDAAHANPEIGQVLRKISYQLECVR